MRAIIILVVFHACAFFTFFRPLSRIFGIFSFLKKNHFLFYSYSLSSLRLGHACSLACCMVTMTGLRYDMIANHDSTEASSSLSNEWRMAMIARYKSSYRYYYTISPRSEMCVCVSNMYRM
ncbi:hypothetical protein HOY80DRAFT_969576 [Tuber brumale]|nr:hypothetical protein HOY80DRAFT_969576 [Tuber brumale]